MNTNTIHLKELVNHNKEEKMSCFTKLYSLGACDLQDLKASLLMSMLSDRFFDELRTK
jgi:hypothetical protein